MAGLNKLMHGITAACALLLAAAAAPPGSVTYQVDPAHSGGILLPGAFAPPLAKRWSVDLGGPVSYPIVAEGLVIVSVANTGGGGNILFALDAGTGTTVWEKAVGNSSGAYLAYDRGRLFYTDFSGPLQAFRASDGKALWATQLPGQFYFNFVPVAAHGRLFTGGDESGTSVYAVNEENGALIWTRLLDGGGLGPTLGDGSVFFGVPCDVPAYAAASGKLRWNYNTGCDGGGGAVGAYYAGRVYAPGVDPGVVLDAKTGAVLGSLTGQDAPAFWGNDSYTIFDAKLVATDLTTGNIAWTYAPPEALSLPPIVVNAVVYALSQTGHLYAVDAASGKLLQIVAGGVGPHGTSPGAPGTGLGAGDGVLIVPSGSLLSAYAPG